MKLMQLLHQLLAKLLRRNLNITPKSVIVAQMSEPRPLPMGITEFNIWSDRLIAGAMVTATVESQKATLASMILHLGPTEDHKPDAYFIHSLRKLAANQVANEVFTQIRQQVKERLAKEEQASKNRADKAVEATTELRVVANEPLED